MMVILNVNVIRIFNKTKIKSHVGFRLIRINPSLIHLSFAIYAFDGNQATKVNNAFKVPCLDRAQRIVCREWPGCWSFLLLLCMDSISSGMQIRQRTGIWALSKNWNWNWPWCAVGNVASYFLTLKYLNAQSWVQYRFLVGSRNQSVFQNHHQSN